MNYKGRVYIASAFINRRKVNAWAWELEKQGYKVVSTWHYESDVEGDRRFRKYAERDVEELEMSDTLILFTENHDDSQGGMWVELGYALAKGMKIVVIGPMTACVFNRLEHLERYAELESFLYGDGE